MTCQERRPDGRPRRVRGLAIRGLARLAAALALGLLGPASLAAEGPVPSTGLRITGRVELPAGTSPAARAAVRVELVPALEDDDSARRELAGAPPPPPLAAVHPDREGVFALAAPGPGCYRVAVRAEGFLAVDHLFLPLIEDAELPPARLAPAAPVFVRAMDALGRPVAGLRLAATAAPGAWWEGQEPPAWRPAARAGQTGADGRLAFPRAAGEALQVEVVDPRHLGASLLLEDTGAAAPTAIDGGAVSPPADTALRLAGRPPLVLEARDPAGHPVAGALLRLGDGRPTAVAGEDGRLAVSFDDPRLAGLARPATLASSVGELLGEVDWSRARDGRLTVALAPVREVRGRLAERTTGAAVGGGLVWIERTDGYGPTGVAAMAEAGADGRFRIRARTADGLRPGAGARGFRTARPEAPAAGAGPWTIALDRAAGLDGVVVDAGGRGVAGAAIAFRPPFPVPAGPPRARSGADGRFHLADLVAGERYELLVTAPGFAPATVAARVRRPEPEKPEPPVRIVLPAGRSLAGTVVDDAGRPLAGVEIVLLPFEGLPISMWKSHADDGSVRRARSDASGAFEIAHLAPGRYGLAAHGEGLATTLRDGIDLAAGEAPLDLGRLVVARGAAIAGRIVDRRGAPVGGAMVESTPVPKGVSTPIESSSLASGRLMLGDRMDSDVVRAGADGCFEIAGLRRGDALDLQVHAEGHPGASRRGVRAPTEEPLAIVLDDGGRVSGRVVDSERRPVFGARVSGEEPGRREAMAGGGAVDDIRGAGTSTDARGVFSIVGLPAGAVDLYAEAPGYLGAERRGVEVAAGRETVGIEIVLDAGSSLSGHLRDAAGRPVAGAGLLAERQESPAEVAAAIRGGERPTRPAQGRTDADGAYRLEGLATGPYQVIAFAGRQRAQATVDVHPGENALDLTVEKESGAAEVSGRVVDSAGAPIAGASVSLRGESPSLPVSTLADGSFAFSRVPAGEYLLSAAARGYAAAGDPEPVAVAGDAVSGLTVVLVKAIGSIHGRLAGLDPAELPRVQVAAIPSGPEGPAGPGGLANVAGTVEGETYRIDDLAPGRWSVVALSDSGRRASGIAMLAPEKPEAVLDLDFASGATLSGRVTRDGLPVAGAEVIAGTDDPSKVPGQSDTAADGSFRISGLAPAAYVVAVIDPRRPAISVLTVALGGDRRMEIDLTAGALHGRVLDPSGAPVGGAEVILTGIDPPRPAGLGGAMPTATTGADGGFDVPSLAVGRYQVTARAAASREGAGAGQEVVVAPHATAQVEIRLGSAP